MRELVRLFYMGNYDRVKIPPPTSFLCGTKLPIAGNGWDVGFSIKIPEKTPLYTPKP